MATIREIIESTIELIEDSTNFFDRAIKDLENSIYKATLLILDRFNKKDGKFDDNDTSKLLDIDSVFRETVDASDLAASLDQYRENFDLLEKLEKGFFELTLREPELEDLVGLFKQVQPFKAKIINDLNQNVLGSGLSVNILDKVRDDIFEAVILKTKVQDLQEKVADSIVSVEGNNSRMLSYVKQISRDALRAYKGAIQERARVTYGLDKMTYTGGVIDTTRQNCFDMLRSENKFKKFAIRKGQYRVEDIEEMLSLAKVCEPHHTLTKADGTPKIDCGNGFKKGTVLETFAAYAFGWACLHLVYYSRLTARDRKLIEEKNIGSSNA